MNRLVPLFLALGFSTAVGASPNDTVMADSIHALYAEQNVAALQRVFEQTDDRALALLCRYRLYPLTRDPDYLDDLPTELEQPTARELALLSGLWGYRVMETSFLRVPAFGRRAARLMDHARSLDPDDPFVLLIDGQSLLFRPGLLGGDSRKALERFRRLRDELERTSDSGISILEADLWIWYAMAMLKDDEAPAFRARLLEQDLPPLYRAFLTDPP